MTNWILTYYQQIENGSVNVSKWVRKEYENIVNGIEDGSLIYDAKKANNAVAFMERYVHHSKGELAPQRLVLQTWQKAGIAAMFGIMDPEQPDTRMYREVLWLMGRKDGKSLIASGVASKLAFADGEYGAEIYMIAPKLDQADIVFSDLWASVQQEPALLSRSKKRQYDILIPESNTYIKKLPFSSRKSDGLNVHGAICDEIAAWQGDAGIKQYQVITSSLGARRQPLIFSITTANYVQDGIYQDLYSRATSVILGTSKEKHFLPLLYQIDDIDKWNDLNELQKSIPNLGVSVSHKYILNEIDKAESSLPNKMEFLTKFCCVTQGSATAWLDMQTVKKTESEEIRPEKFEKTYACVGIDLSKAVDLTSACFIIEKDGVVNVLSHFWMPQERLQIATEEDRVPYDIYRQRGILSLSGENHVDYKDVFNWILQVTKEYKILPVVIGYDPYSSHYLIDDLNDAGLKTDDVRQGFNLTGIILELEGLAKDGKLKTGNNTLLQMHLANTALEFDRDFARRRIVKIDKRSRIDGTAALLCALCVRQKWWGEYGAMLQNRR